MMKSGNYPLLFLLLAFGCKTTGGSGNGQGDLVEAPPTKEVKELTTPKRDIAASDFRSEADAIQKDVESGDVDWSDVASRMEDITRKHTQYGLGWYNLGVAYEKLGRSADAKKAYGRASDSDRKLREARENLAAMAAREGRRGEATNILRELVARDPGAAQARVALAQQHLADNELDDASQLAIEALGHEARLLGAYCVLAEVAVRRKNFSRARLLVVQGLKLGKKAACLHQTLGRVALAEKDTAAALVSFETATANDASLTEAQFRIAQISLGFKDFKKAIDNYVAAAKADPKNVAARVNLGVALKGSGRFEDAEKAYKSAIDAAGDGGVAAAHYNLGVLYLRHMNRLDDAKTHLKRVLQLSDQDQNRVFAMIEEIEAQKAMAEEEKRMEEEARRQEEIDKKIAAEEAKKAAEEAALDAAERERAKDEPGAPDAAAPADPKKPKAKPAAKPKSKTRRRRKAPKPKDKTPEIPDVEDFE